MLRRVQKYIRDHQLLNKGERVLVCVSGGADSIALWDVLCRGGYECIIAHCNFHLRKEESDRDELFVKGMTARFPVSNTPYPIFIKHFDTVEYAQKNGLITGILPPIGLSLLGRIPHSPRNPVPRFKLSNTVSAWSF